MSSGAEYTFIEDRTTAVFICAHVAAGAPVLYVAHDEDGEWQFMCGADDHDDPSGAQLVCLEEVVAEDPTLNRVARMCVGRRAERTDRTAEWRITDPGEAFIHGCIAKYGWSVQGVGAEGDEPAFSYTVGLHHSWKHPEVIVFGLPHDVAQGVLNTVGERIQRGEIFRPGVEYPDVLEGFDLRLRAVSEAQSFKQHVGYALWYYQGQRFDLLQLLWPDKHGCFPDERRAPEWLTQSQPLLP